MSAPLSTPPRLIGRDQERAEVIRRVLGGARLTTVEGPAGVGKTRLAQAVLGAVRTHFPDGVFEVDLAPLTTVSQVAPAVLSALGLRDLGPRPPEDSVLDHLEGRRMLLLLDNHEHLPELRHTVQKWLEGCPDLTLLTTGREALHLPFERTLRLAPFPLPELGATLEALRDNPALRLLLERSNLILSVDNAPELTELVRRLDGLPLALELAAARLDVFEPHILLTRLKAHLPLPPFPGSSQSSRHRSLEAALNWSFELLTEAEQNLFCALGVFAGSASLEAVAQVAQMAINDPLDALLELRDKNLLQTSGGGSRFGLLETLREFAWREAKRLGSLETLRQRHADFYLKFARHEAVQLRGSDQASGIERLEQELLELRLALHFGWERLESTPLALELAATLGPFWFGAHPREGLRWLEQILARSRPRPDRETEHARALDASANLARLLGDLDTALRDAEAALELARRIHQDPLEATVQRNLGVTLRLRGQLEEAETAFTRAYQLNLESDPLTALRDLNGVAITAALRGDALRAVALLEQGLKEAQLSRNRWLIALCLTNLGRVRMDLGEWTVAQALLKQGLGAARALGDRPLLLSALEALGWVRLEQGEFDAAQAFLEELLEEAVTGGDPWNQATAAQRLGMLALRRGQFEESLIWLRRSLDESVALGWTLRAITCLEGAAVLAARWQQWEAVIRFGVTALDARAELVVPASSATQHEQDQVMLEAQGHLDQAASTRVLGLKRLEMQHWSAALARLTPPRAGGGRPTLSPREFEVLHLIAAGKTNKGIARVLGISEHTARFHVTGMLNKLGAQTRAQAVSKASALGLLT